MRLSEINADGNPKKLIVVSEAEMRKLNLIPFYYDPHQGFLLSHPWHYLLARYFHWYRKLVGGFWVRGEIDWVRLKPLVHRFSIIDSDITIEGIECKTGDKIIWKGRGPDEI